MGFFELAAQMSLAAGAHRHGRSHLDRAYRFICNLFVDVRCAQIDG